MAIIESRVISLYLPHQCRPRDVLNTRNSSIVTYVNHLPTTLFYFNFNPFEDVFRYRDPQLQVGDNYTYFNLRHLQIVMFTFCS